MELNEKSDIKSNVEKLSPLQLKLNVEIPSDIVEKTFNRIFSNIQREVTIKGFRKGKAPLAQIKSIYGDRVKQDVVQDLIQNHYPSALTTHKLDPISYPEFEFNEPTDNKNFSFFLGRLSFETSQTELKLSPINLFLAESRSG